MTRPANAALETARSLLPSWVSVAATDPRDVHTVHQDELAVLGKVSDKRRAEFTAGRAAAHDAMIALRCPSASVLISPDRAPIWPKGLTGSISHCETACLVALARSEQARAIGIDVEDASPLDRDLWQTICTESDLAELEQPGMDPGIRAKLIFCAKESAYKAQYPLSQTLFDFDMFDLHLHGGSFSAGFRDTVPGFAKGDILQGRIAMNSGLIIATTLIEH